MLNSRLRLVIALIFAVVVYYGAGVLSGWLFSPSSLSLALLWLPSGVGLIFVLRLGWPALFAIVAASFFVNLSFLEQSQAHGSTYLHALLLATTNSLEAWLAATLLRRFLPKGLHRFRDLVPFIFFVCAPATAITATLVSSNLVYGGYISVDHAWISWLVLCLTNTLGIVLVYPLVVAFRRFEAMTKEQVLRSCSLAIMCLGLTYLGFDLHHGFVFVSLLPLMFLATQGRRDSTYLTLFAVVALTAMLAAQDYGPFLQSTTNSSRLYLLAYLYTIALLVVGMQLHQCDLSNTERARSNWKHLANHDALTQIGNRHLFIPQLEQELQRAERKNRTFTLALIDIDYFKKINDEHGHTAGDSLLQSFATVLRHTLRDFDVAARIGGDEFAILFPETNQSDAERALERIRQKIKEFKLAHQDKPILFTISIGVAQYAPGQGLDVDSFFSQVDQLLYEAKRAGRNQIRMPLSMV